MFIYIFLYCIILYCIILVDKIRHRGYFIWHNQDQVDFLSFRPQDIDGSHQWTFHNNRFQQMQTSGEILNKGYANLTVMMLDRYTALRYCSSNKSETIPTPLTKEQKGGVVVLHCFVNKGPVGEIGALKRDVKRGVMQNLRYWVLNHGLDDARDGTNDVSMLPQGRAKETINSEKGAIRLKSVTNKRRFDAFVQTWINS